MKIVTLISITLIFFTERSYSAASQILSDNFYQNPAELSKVEQLQLIAGNLFIAPKFKYTGQTTIGIGSVTSTVNNNLPYLLSSFRLNKRVVLGINITPSAYGHLEWPLESIVSNITTTTNILYYRTGVQASYQLCPDLAIGMGLNLEINKLEEISYVVPAFGNQISKASGIHQSADIGLFYRINHQHALTAAAYTPVQGTNIGSSSLSNTINNNFSFNATQASIIYVGLQHLLTDKWFLEEKVYWSGWSIQRNILFTNSAMGSFVVPTNWKNVWSYQVNTRYATTEKIALLGSLMYENNPVSIATNSIGYPLAASMFISGGFDFNLQKSLSAQLIYGYGKFMPNATINNTQSNGSITANIQAVLLQFIYKI